jgi:flavin reductase (DIM6/NTAB) family NADH-FMN oxidoreductase RutF
MGANMDADAKKTVLRMIPYGLYIMTAEDKDGEIAAATVNWVTQTSFDPPLVVVGVKVESGAHEIAIRAGCFALNMLGKDQQGFAFSFFKPAERDGNTINGEPYHGGGNGAPILENTPASVECVIRQIVEMGDHHVFVGEVTGVALRKAPEGRADEAILHMRELGEKVFYGG